MNLQLFPPEGDVSVWDTSAIIALKENNIQRSVRRHVLGALKERAEGGRLFVAREVVKELEKFSSAGSSRVHDEFVKWARACPPAATTVPIDFAAVRQVIARVPSLVDADAHDEEADPYVLTLAIELQRSGLEVVVVTEDRRDKPMHMSLASACGIFRLPSIPLLPFLHDEGLLP